MTKAHTATEPAPPGGHPKTVLYQLVEAKLAESPIQLIRDRRSQDPPVAYWKIAREITEKTDVDVTLEAVRRWHHWDLAAARP